MRHTTGRAIGVLIATSLTLGLVAAPVAAVEDPTTVYVGRVPTAAPLTGGSCDSPDYIGIQDAVANVAPGSTILVCPGIYREQVTITKSGLTIRATRPWKAGLRPPTSCTSTATRPATCGVPHVAAGARPAGTFDLLTIDGADGVTVQWLKLLAPTKGACLQADTMIRVTGDADDTTIRANRIRPTGGGNAYNGPCGYGSGIVVDGGSSAWVGYNLVQDFRVGGLGFVVDGAGTDATVVRNSVRFHHTGVAAGGSGTGIHVVAGATGRVKRNTIVGLDTALISTPWLNDGIHLSAAGTGTVVRDNLVRHAYSGLFLDSSTTGAKLVRNELRDGGYGIYVGTRSSGNLFRGNTALGYYKGDCRDTTTGGGTGGTANTWTNNTGATGSPAGICTPPAP